MTTLVRPDRDPIVPLQFLRGLAASGVVLEHLFDRYKRRGVMPEGVPELLGNLGQTGVATFFAISGFIMVYISLRSGQAPQGGLAFLRGRYLRIAPLYYLTTILMVVFAWATSGARADPNYRLPTATEWVLSAAFVPHRGAKGVIQPIYELGWTLHYEMFFYLLFAIGLSLFARRGAYLTLGLLALLVAIGTRIGAPPDVVGPRVLAYVFTRPIVVYFGIGIAVALLRDRLSRQFPALPVPILIVTLAAALIVASLDISELMTMVAVAIALVVTVLPWRASGKPGRVSAFSRAFGDASYSIYLTHSFLLGAFAAATASIAARGLPALAAMGLLSCLLCFAVGWLTWRLVETPIGNRIRGRRPTEIDRTAP
ncbi:acyltransferase family protein [Sphingomonas sp. 3-13AW]|uniref:acyltransferase family protein n=1 Tax=Sphingomonas sp. 3-13AW TaxID=3050450 RepID=UPI003BB6E466